jgi:coproporphyrinogen III oxidase
MASMFDQASRFFAHLQDQICDALARLDGTAFREDAWTHADSGGGRTRILSEGKVFEKAGVNFSSIRSQFKPEFAHQIPGEGLDFAATGVSLVLHPWNPHQPTVHANFRYLTRGESKSWFGGGADLTPYYLYAEDAVHFHQTWKKACDRHPAVADYSRFKKWCDEYFYLPHRRETRGVGGIFFDYLESSAEETFAFVRDAGESFLPAYLPIAERRQDASFSPAQRDFQLYRRGRYVEFNLIYDRGTVFGLKTGGRIESILMSLPLTAKWLYDWKPTEGSEEAKLYEVITQPRDWV